VNIAICDDENEFLEKEKISIEKIINEEYPELEIKIFCYRNGYSLINNCEDVDIVFLDIELKEEDGFDIAKQLIEVKKYIKIIFVTSHENLVYNAFVFRPVGFIRKYLFDNEIKIVIPQVINSFIDDNKMIEIGESKNTYVISLGRVKYIDTFGHNIIVKMSDKTISVRDKLSRIDKILTEQNFLKINRGCMINMQFIEEFINDNILVDDGENFKISRSRLENCKKQYKRFMGLG
jgi:DNA-binding LytR/AlgR family response regulator